MTWPFRGATDRLNAAFGRSFHCVGNWKGGCMNAEKRMNVTRKLRGSPSILEPFSSPIGGGMMPSPRATLKCSTYYYAFNAIHSLTSKLMTNIEGNASWLAPCIIQHISKKSHAIYTCKVFLIEQVVDIYACAKVLAGPVSCCQIHQPV